jgi:hypothetical protein
LRKSRREVWLLDARKGEQAPTVECLAPDDLGETDGGRMNPLVPPVWIDHLE